MTSLSLLSYAGIFLVSAAALVFQVAQTRLFSATLGYHLTYLVISVSLLGVGAGATVSAVLDRRRLEPSRARLAIALGASCLLALVVETHIDPITDGLALTVLASYVMGALPFLFASWIVVALLRREPERGGRLYAADLAGAGIGSILAFVAIPIVGVPALYGIAALLASLGAVFFAPRAPLVGIAPALAIASVVALGLWSEVLTPPKLGPLKALNAFAAGVTREATRWDPQARVDVLRGPGTEEGAAYAFLMDPAFADDRPAALDMVLDLGASTPILNGGGDLKALQASLIGAPYALLERPRVLVIGPGGGIDIQTALVHGAASVDAVEVNRTVVDLMQHEFAGYSGGPYLDPRVRVWADEARSFVRRSPARYDLIAMTVVDSWAALSSGSLALTESYLYTEEAFADYFRHLSSDGMLAVGRWYRDPPVEMLRTARVAARGATAVGIVEPERHLVVLRHGGFGLLLARPAPFDLRALERIRGFAERHHFDLVYDPLRPQPPFDDALADRDGVPTTDDRPFFFADNLWQDDARAVPVAYAILYLALVAALVLSYAVVLFPLRRLAVRALSVRPAGVTTMQSLAVGFGFIAAEIVLLQRLTLYLGQPALALSVGLAAILIGAAVGSALSERARLGIGRAALASSTLIALALIGLAWISDVTLSWPLPMRLVVAAIAVGSAGVPMGAVFPGILARAASADPVLVPWAWAVNGAASVVGSILAFALAIVAGFTAVGAAAVLCYALVIASDAVGRRGPVGRSVEVGSTAS